MSHRVVLDTNVLIAAARTRNSASRKLVLACHQGDLRPVVSRQLVQEYDLILRRALRNAPDSHILEGWIDAALTVAANPREHPFPDDPEDSKVLATAVAGEAVVLVTNDRCLLGMDPYQGVRVMRPGAAVAHLGVEPTS